MITTSLLGGTIDLTKAPEPLELTSKASVAREKALGILIEADNTAGTPVNRKYVEKIFEDVRIFYNFKKYKTVLMENEQAAIDNFFANCDSESGFLLKDRDVREILGLIKEGFELN